MSESNLPRQINSPLEKHSPPRYGRILILLFLCWYSFTTFGGIRGADEEIVYRTGESLILHGSFAVEDIGAYPGFGVTRGTDGKKYSIYGPLQSILITPFIVAGKIVNTTEWYKVIPPPVSIFVGTPSQPDYYIGPVPVNQEPHAMRFIASFFNVLVGSLTVYTFFRLLIRFAITPATAFLLSIVFGAGTLFQAYTSTLFSEPLTTGLTLFSLYFLIDASATEGKRRFGTSENVQYALSGIILGLASTAHLSAVLFAPFFLYYCVNRVWKNNGTGQSTRPALNAGFSWLAGFMTVLLLLGYYNFVRFGGFLETGRTVDPEAALRLGYGHFESPWLGLYGLTVSLGKGLLWYCPIILLTIPGWIQLWRRDRSFAAMLLTMIVFRIVFIAARSDWAGGLCLGPRYLVPIIPFLLVPLAFWLNERTRDNRSYFWTLGFSALCIVQQWYFSLGDSILFYLKIVKANMSDPAQLFGHWEIYRSPAFSPLLHSFQMERAPFLLNVFPLSNEWLFITGLIALVLGLVYCYRLASDKRSGIPENKTAS